MASDKLLTRKTLYNYTYFNDSNIGHHVPKKQKRGKPPMFTMKKRNSKLILNTLMSVFVLTMILFSPSPARADGSPTAGEVISTIDSGGYTYIEAKDGGETFWLAAPNVFLQKGDKINFDGGMWMPNFKSKALDRTFDKILFVDGISLGAGGGAKSSVTPPGEKKKKKAKKKSSGKVQKVTVEDAYKKSSELENETIEIKGKVVKVSKMIMGMNWIHIQDGTGNSSDGSNNIVFRSKTEAPNVGDKVTAKGILNVDVDFGAGYFYKVIAEGSTFK